MASLHQTTPIIGDGDLHHCSRCGHLIGDIPVHLSKHDLFDTDAVYNCEPCQMGFETQKGWASHCAKVHSVHPRIHLLPNSTNLTIMDMKTIALGVGNNPNWFDGMDGWLGTGNISTQQQLEHPNPIPSPPTHQQDRIYQDDQSTNDKDDRCTSGTVSPSTEMERLGGKGKGVGQNRSNSLYNHFSTQNRPSSSCVRHGSQETSGTLTTGPTGVGGIGDGHDDDVDDSCLRCGISKVRNNLKHQQLHENYDRRGKQFVTARCKSCELAYSNRISLVGHYEKRLCPDGVRWCVQNGIPQSHVATLSMQQRQALGAGWGRAGDGGEDESGNNSSGVRPSPAKRREIQMARGGSSGAGGHNYNLDDEKSDGYDHHHDDGDNNPDLVPRPEPKYKIEGRVLGSCDRCGILYKFPIRENQHMTLHNNYDKNSAPFQCQTCELAWNTPIGLEGHLTSCICEEGKARAANKVAGGEGK